MKLGEQSGWRIDRHVPVALVLTIILQTGAALMWSGAAAERLSALELRSARTDEVVERTARLEEQTKAMRASLTRIEEKLDRAIAR
ncbi:MAG: hypothetical protein Q7S99_15575 [Parvibaculum sp.]|nr:hypothetical protein [Parvibaculum sp.]|tara:strand:- start:19502 stop:19759 length:258 start_codon:yes stop_codon:yes gene_type:complete